MDVRPVGLPSEIVLGTFFLRHHAQYDKVDAATVEDL